MSLVDTIGSLACVLPLELSKELLQRLVRGRTPHVKQRLVVSDELFQPCSVVDSCKFGNEILTCILSIISFVTQI